jgi:hypothetical protein
MGGAETGQADEHLEAYRDHLARVVQLDASHGSTPTPRAVEHLEGALASYRKWLEASKPSPTRDLEFQLDSLRGRIAGLEAESHVVIDRYKQQLRASSEERSQLEQRVLELSRSLGKALRPFPQNRDLFRKLRGGTMRALG